MTGRVLFAVIALGVFAVDRLTKSLVMANIPFGTEVPAIDHVVGIANVHNSGAAFGFAPAGTGLFLAASSVVAVGLAIYVARHPGDTRTDAVLGLIMGGTLGNGYDRFVFGTVTDFINVHFWPVFNVADSAVSIGVVALLAGYLLRRPAAA
ncbi:MAG: signal peptidase II [Candidatus Dormibacteraeota bacterium]|nr:signal peptidase II [Candidatus Dormibacteraeota bacterium]